MRQKKRSSTKTSKIFIFQKISNFPAVIFKKSDQSSPLNNTHVVCKIVNVNNGIYRYMNCVF
ncbi:hypothetical protein CPter91_1539 [Collimonas pratensis]|uniref:Uncharacterized protein n=1 Tax=Collimonas pratensis TaxID=279113 RepID=A0A127Q1N6_9BURK|nr:hypothetical protein CPter91_1539 [Collimonas pratensis]